MKKSNLIRNSIIVALGWALHTVYWASVGGFHMVPFSRKMWELHKFELPVAAVYFDPGMGVFRYGSLVIGGLYWGFVLLGIFLVIRKIFTRRKATAA